MKLILTEITRKQTVQNAHPYIEMTFYYGEKNKTVVYSVWSFIHTEANHLRHVWDNAEKAQVGQTFNLRFHKADIDGKEQFVVTMLEEIVNH